MSNLTFTWLKTVTRKSIQNLAHGKIGTRREHVLSLGLWNGVLVVFPLICALRT